MSETNSVAGTTSEYDANAQQDVALQTEMTGGVSESYDRLAEYLRTMETK